MVFKSIKDFESYILGKCEEAIAQTQEITRKDVINQAQAFYDSYDPVLYERTNQLTDNGGQTEKFIIKSPINRSGNKCSATVHLDAGGLSYTTGLSPSGEDVVAVAVKGGHGAKNLKVVYSGGVNLWNPELQSKAKSDLMKALMAQGI